MSEELRLRVRCDKCGKSIGEVYEDGSALRYRPIFPGVTNRADTLANGRFWCAEHGYASADQIEAAVATSDGKTVKTLRARME